MLIDLRNADYIAKAIQAIDLGKAEIPLTDTCPECGLACNTWERANDGAHLVYAVTSDTFAILIACEGYWVINPELVGLPRGSWIDWQDEPVCVLDVPDAGPRN